jgi:ABC-2 type transport system ATP-binding protein
MHSIIEIKNLKKIFMSGAAEVTAVNGVDLNVHTGEIFGFLGPNGAGKTTTMRILTTLLKPTSGTCLVAGYDVMTQEEHVRKSIGYVSQAGGLERSATARENLILQARVYGMNKAKAHERADELIKALGISPFADRLVETYSGGQRRKADIALGMVHHPKLLFLDEPTIALDPQSRIQIWQEIKKLKNSGTTIFFTTHYLDEADLYCDRVAIVDQGKIVALGTPHDLKKSLAEKHPQPTLDDVFMYKTGHSFRQDT